MRPYHVFWAIFGCTLSAVCVRCDRAYAIDAIVETMAKVGKNYVVHLLVECSADNLRYTMDTMRSVRNAPIDENIKFNVQPFDAKGTAARPKIFMKTITELLDALENHACAGRISYEGWELRAKLHSIVPRTDEQAHQRDAILVFVATDELGDAKVSGKHPINVVWTGPSRLPDSYAEMASRTNGLVLVFGQTTNSLKPQEMRPHKAITFNEDSNYKLSTTTRSLTGNTKTEFELPEKTTRIALNLHGNVDKAMLMPTPGIAINITSESYRRTMGDPSNAALMRDTTVFYDTPVRGDKSTHWTLVADGEAYVASLLTVMIGGRTDDHVEQQRRKKADMRFENVTFRAHNFLLRVSSNMKCAARLKSNWTSNEEYQHGRDDVRPVEVFKNNEQQWTRRQDPPETMQSFYDAAALIKRQGGRDELAFEPGLSGSLFLDTFNSNNLLTKVDVDQLSTFYAFPGEEVRIVFNVKNLKPIPSVYDFRCFYMQRPCSLQPMHVNLLPEQRIQIYATVRAEGSEGSSSVVTFVAQSMDMAERKMYLYIGKPKSDNRKPDIDYEYNGNCDDANTGSTCHQRRWSANLWAHDWDTGLLSFWSEPPGLVYGTDFIAGTREKIAARFSASCCDPKADILASDLRGNTYKITLNIERQYFNALEITAMILGLVLLIIIIITVIYAIVKWRRRRNERAFLG